VYDDHFSSACNVKDEQAKRKTTNAGNVSGGVEASTCRCSRVKNTCSIQSLFGDRTRQTFSDQNSLSCNTRGSVALIDLRKNICTVCDLIV
jgi:hypothetical protein